MKMYRVNYNEENDNFVADDTFTNINYFAQFDYIFDFGYFSKIPMDPNCIVELKDGGAILDVYPVGQISKNIINYFNSAIQEENNILVAVDIRNCYKDIQVSTESKSPLILVHSDTNPGIKVAGKPNFIAKIYEVPFGEKIKFKENGKTIFIIDNTQNSPVFINIR